MTRPPICVRLLFTRRRAVTVRRFLDLELAVAYAVKLAALGLAVHISREG